jgi:glycosyltransferase involved in cell wall biosynthesis
VKVSVVLPCLNEEATVGICVRKCLGLFEREGWTGEVVVVDNGSGDQSVEAARAAGARVVNQPLRGYGAAYLKGLSEARGEYVVMGDADDTYDFNEIPVLLNELDNGNDMVIGSRFMGRMARGAMSFSHRYLGNPVLTNMLNVCFKTRISDAHSGFRAVRRSVLSRLALHTTGMEFASEMIVAALREDMRIKEVPIVYHPRRGESKLQPFMDAWRHIRFMLLFSPDWLFLVPGLTLAVGGFLLLVLAGAGRLVFLGHRFDLHAMIFFAFCSLLGFQILTMGLSAKVYGVSAGFIRRDALLERGRRWLTLERGLIAGVLLFVSGLTGSGYVMYKWIAAGFGSLDKVTWALVGLLLMTVGIQTVFSSFFLSMLYIQRKVQKSADDSGGPGNMNNDQE